jgi:hypothetical protein
MRINLEEISSRIKQEIANYSTNLTMDEVGTVVELGDGIARIYGMRGAMAMEMLEFETGVYGLALNLEEDSIGAVILGEPAACSKSPWDASSSGGSSTRWASRWMTRDRSPRCERVRSSSRRRASGSASR